ncbi:MAG: MFS transporter [Fimbriiglobus sp.]
MTAPAQSAPPTRVRYAVLALLCLLAMITYLDRAMYGSAKGDIMAAVGRPVEDFFWVLTAFQLAYALFEIPTGWLGDRFGPRMTLVRLVLWWSFFVAFTPTIGLIFPHTAEIFGTAVPLAFLALIAAEFLFGMGEAGAFPNISKAAYNWFPATQRGFAKGAVWMAARLAGGLTPLIWVLLTAADYGGLSWRQALWVFSGVAVVWSVAFLYWFRNLPSEHTATNAAERNLIEGGRGGSKIRGAVPWGTLVRSRNLWALCVMYMVTNFNWYYLLYYLPQDLKRQYQLEGGTSPLLVALVGGGPLLVGMFGCFLGGVLSDRYIRRTGNRRWGRRLYGMLGYGLAGAAYLAAAALTGAGNFWWLAGCLVLVGFFNDLIMGPAWAATQDIGGRYSAIVGGSMNMIGNLGAVLGIQATGRILKAYTADGVVLPAGYTVCFTVYAVVYALGVVSWLMIDTTKPVAPDEA